MRLHNRIWSSDLRSMVSIVLLTVSYLHVIGSTRAETLSQDDLVSVFQTSASLRLRNSSNFAVAPYQGPMSTADVSDIVKQREANVGASEHEELLEWWKWTPLKKGEPSYPFLIAFGLVAIVMLVVCYRLYSEAAEAEEKEPGTEKHTWKHGLLAGGFGFVNGWVDAICLIRYNAFATMMTGNLFQLGYTIIYPKVLEKHDKELDQAVGRNATQALKHVWRLPDPFFFTAIIVMYCLGTVIYRTVEIRLGRRTATYVGPTLALGIVLYEIADAFSKNAVFGHPRWIVCFLAPVFSVQNYLTTKGGLGLPTAFLSGHLQEVTLAALTLITGEEGTYKRGKIAMQLMIILAVVAGAIAAAGCDRLFKNPKIVPQKYFDSDLSLVPIAPMIAFLYVMHDRMFYGKTDPPDAAADADVSAEPAAASETR